MSDPGRPAVIIRKVREKARGDAHGGAWKVAYADFVTAMMAFFLLLWLLNVSEQEVLDGLSNYFTPTLIRQPVPSGAGGMFGGIAATDPGEDDDFVKPDSLIPSTTPSILETEQQKKGEDDTLSTGDPEALDAIVEEERFVTAKETIDQSMDELPPEFQDLKDTVKVEVTDEGLRLEIIDQDRTPMFGRGSERLTPRALKAMEIIAGQLAALPNDLSLSGHVSTEAGEVGNWGLSIGRANAVRRALIADGIPVGRFIDVLGKGDTDHYDPENPDTPANRRVTLVALRIAPAAPDLTNPLGLDGG